MKTWMAGRDLLAVSAGDLQGDLQALLEPIENQSKTAGKLRENGR